MEPHSLLEATHRMLLIVLLVSLPVVVVTVVVGLIVGALQAVTQIQDQSVAFGAKFVASIVVIALFAPWAGGQLYVYAQQAFDSILGVR